MKDLYRSIQEYINSVLVLNVAGFSENLCCKCERSLSDLVNELDESFSQSLLRLIDQKGLEDCDVYRKANVDRRLFSKIRKDVNYRPKKKTVLAFVFALHLNLDESLDLLKRAGYTLSHSDVFDIVVEYCIVHEIYDLDEVNDCLNEFGQSLIGV